jgi:hypothetical protein
VEFWRCEFYQRWVVEKPDKPFWIAETGAGYNIFRSGEGAEYNAMKRSWFENVFEVVRDFDRWVLRKRVGSTSLPLVLARTLPDTFPHPGSQQSSGSST